MSHGHVSTRWNLSHQVRWCVLAGVVIAINGCGGAAGTATSATTAQPTVANPGPAPDCTRDAYFEVACSGACMPLAEQRLHLFCDDGAPVLGYDAGDAAGEEIELAREQLTAVEWNTRWAELDRLGLAQLRCDDDPARQRIEATIDGKTVTCASPRDGATAGWDALREAMRVAGKATIERVARPPATASLAVHYKPLATKQPTGEVHGTLSQAGGRLVGATVVIASLDPSAPAKWTFITEEDGAFAFTGLAPGTYRLVVFHDGDQAGFELEVRKRVATELAVEGLPDDHWEGLTFAPATLETAN